MQDSTEILFEKFRINACFKKDSYNAVYMADHIYLGKKIILKTLNTLELKDTVILERFKREARIMALLDHPNLIKVLDFGMYSHHFYISFEYFESRNLRELISENKLTYDQKSHLLIQLLKALNVAHQNNIVHRDIKPENILVNKNYDLKIADFGLAIALDETILTHKASIVGTPGYMSPEQIKGERMSVQSDIFSLGIVALELFTGSNPFIGKTINETINNILGFKDEKIYALIANLSPSVQQAIQMMLRKNPPERGKSINELLSLLGVAGEFFTPVEVKVKRKKRRRRMLASSFTLSIFSIILLVYLLTPAEKPTGYSFGNSELMPMNNSEPAAVPAENDTNLLAAETSTLEETQGRLMVEAAPWADIYINGRKVNTTPLVDFINLNPGTYRLKLVHPDFPAYERRIKISSDKLENINISFKDIAGYLDCKVYPWAEIYINDEYKSQTPLREPILLMPGKYKLTLKNPQYGSFSEMITIKSKDVNEFRYNFESNKETR
jgi:serine/threonine protein kinase